MLYPSSSAKNVIAPNGRNLKQSLTPNGTRVNPVNSFPIRRVSAIQSIGPVDLVGNSNLRATRTFSKWEKQEREALSLAHLSKKEEPVNAMKRQTGALLESTPTLLLGNGSGPSQQPPAAFANAPATTSTNRISFTIPVDSKIDTPTTAKLSTSDLPALTIPFSPERAQEAMKPSMAPFSLTFAPAQTTEQPNVVVWSAPPPLPALNPFSFAKPAYTPAAATQSSAPFTPACNLSFFSKPAEANATGTQAAVQQSTTVPDFFWKPPASAALDIHSAAEKTFSVVPFRWTKKGV